MNCNSYKENSGLTVDVHSAIQWTAGDLHLEISLMRKYIGSIG